MFGRSCLLSNVGSKWLLCQVILVFSIVTTVYTTVSQNPSQRNKSKAIGILIQSALVQYSTLSFPGQMTLGTTIKSVSWKELIIISSWAEYSKGSTKDMRGRSGEGVTIRIQCPKNLCCHHNFMSAMASLFFFSEKWLWHWVCPFFPNMFEIRKNLSHILKDH